MSGSLHVSFRFQSIIVTKCKKNEICVTSYFLIFYDPTKSDQIMIIHKSSYDINIREKRILKNCFLSYYETVASDFQIQF